MSKKYFHAIATLMGTIIGVGMFSIPFVAFHSGMLLFVLFLFVLGGIQYYMHLIFAEIYLSTRKRHRVPGYVKEYFGKNFKKPALALVLTAGNLSVLSYLIIGGIFLYQIFSPAFGGSHLVYSFILFLLTALATFKGIKLISNIELLLSVFLFLVIGIIAFKGLSSIEVANYNTIVWENFFLPYGPVFLALGGMNAIPTVCTLLAHKKSNIKSAIFWGTFIPIVITVIFVFTIVGITGPTTSQDALAGLKGNIDDGVLLTALIFGLISVITSLMMAVEAMKEVYWWDLGMKKNNSWALSLVVPFVLFLLGINNLVSVVTITGAVVGGLIGTIYILLILKVKQAPQRESAVKVKINRKIGAFISSLFILGFFSIFEYVGFRTIIILFLVLLFYLYALISSDKRGTSIYFELFETGKKASLVFMVLFFIALAIGVFSVIM